MAEQPMHSVSVAGVVVNAVRQVLLIQRRDNRHWEPPGGVLELQEGPEEGLRREVVEETGLIVEIDRLSGVYKNLSRGVVSLVFVCRPAGGTESISDESIRVEWVTLEVARKRMDPAYYVRVSDAFTNEVPVRVHDGVHLIE